MKKREKKLSLHRETVVRLENVADEKLVRVAGGEMTSCGDARCYCPISIE